MKTLKNTQDKIQEICDVLKHEMLAPAEKQAAEIIDKARQEAKNILDEANHLSQKLLFETTKEIEQKKNVYHSSLAQASTQAIESLRQSIVSDLFNKELSLLIENKSSSTDIVSKLIDAVLEALDKEGTNANLSVFIPKHLVAADVNRTLAARVLERLKSGSVEIGNFQSGIKVKSYDKNISIDITDQALKELFSTYLKKPEFRELIFNAG